MIKRIKQFIEARHAEAIWNLVGKPEFLARAMAGIDLETLSSFEAKRDASNYINERMQRAKPMRGKREIMEEAVQHLSVDGFIAEFGVYRGESLRQIISLCPQRRIFGFDSFQGLPENWRNGYPASTFSTEIPVLSDHQGNVTIVPGWFKDTIGSFARSLAEGDKASFLHVDCDLYSSTCEAIEPLIERIVPGTVILFDEYFAYPGWRQGEWAAWRDICSRYHISYHYIAYNRAHEQVCVVIENVGGS